MAFSKSFPRSLKGSTYPVWEEVFLSEEEEREAEIKAKSENEEIMKECIDESKKILNEKGIKVSDREVILVAISLFDKLGSHQVYHKEAKAKEKFDGKLA
jgi:hypothetical protein